MPGPLDDIEFLARSGNRVVALQALSSRPQTRAELEDSTGISKVTVGRVLEDFIERGWISESNDRYRTTRTGEAIVSDFSQLQTTVETAQKLYRIAPFLDALTFDVRHLEDAQITIPETADPLAPFERPIALLRGARRARFLSRMISPVVLAEIREAVIQKGQRIEGIMSSNVLDRIETNPDLETHVQKILGSEEVRAYLYDGEIEIEVAEIDDIVAILITDNDDIPRVFIESTDETVREWFDELFEAYLERADPLTAEAIARKAVSA